jgi:hypothetical protein
VRKKRSYRKRALTRPTPSRPFAPSDISNRQYDKQQKDERIRRSSQRKVEEAVYQNPEAPGHRARNNAPVKTIVLSAERRDALSEEKVYKGRDTCECENASVGEHLQVIVMRVFDPVHTAPRVVARRCGTERFKAGTEDRVGEEDLPGNIPKMRTAARNVARVRLQTDPAEQ